MRKVVAVLLTAVLTMSCLAGCGNGGKGSSKDGRTQIQVKYWLAGLGSSWIDEVIEGFEAKYPEYKIVLESTSSSSAINSSLGKPELDETDLYLNVKTYNTEGYLEPLDDILEYQVKGETKTIGEKFDPTYLQLEKSPDGHYYNLTYGGGMVGIYYNKKLFKNAGIKTVPRTTDELALACDTLFSSDIVPFCHFKPVGYWEDYMALAFFAQYDGLDYVTNRYFGCTDEKGVSPSLNVFTEKNGRYQALKVLEGLVTPEYTLTGSNTYDHVTIQTMLINESAAMMVNGTWLSSEMASVGGTDDFGMMRTPVISAIRDKLTTVATDIELRALVTAIDSVIDGEKTEADYKQGDNYVVEGKTVSAADWAYVKAARNTMALNATGNSALIPNYSDNIEGAKEFLKYLYSDEGYTIYANALQQTMPLSLSEGELDMSKWTKLAQQQAQFMSTTEQFVSMYNASAHDIFTLGGARWLSIYTYCDRFCSSNVSDRITAEQAWKSVVTYAKESYDVWLKDISK